MSSSLLPIHTASPAERVLCLIGDIDRDGIPDIVIGSRAPQAELFWLRRTAAGQWQSHLIDSGFSTLEAGGLLLDLDGDGDLDLLAGHDGSGDRLFWWQCPADPTRPWRRHEICRMPANKSHDQIAADLDGDGRPEIYFWNQKASTLFCVPVPSDPTVTPWPDLHPVATDICEEGLAVADVDSDGRPELIAGQSWYKPLGNRRYERHILCDDLVSTRIVAADFDRDGRIELAMSEGDASLNKREFGRLVLLKSGPDPRALWNTTILHDRLLDPHSLAVADFDHDGLPDLYVGEMGLPLGNHPHAPSHRIFYNRSGRLVERVIHQDMIGTHESKPIQLDGRWTIVTKPFRLLRSTLPRQPEVDTIHLLVPET